MSEALGHPAGSFSLSDTVKPNTTVGVVVDSLVPPDLRRKAIDVLKTHLGSPSSHTLKVFLRQRISDGSPRQLEGLDSGYSVINPSQGSFTEIGRTASGTVVSLQEELLKCDTKVVVSLVAPHFASGFTGGPEAILPGASSLETAMKNRSLMVRGVRSPIEYGENLVLSDSLEACKLTGPIYSLCLVPDGWGGLDSVFSGELEPVFKEATSRYLQVHSPKTDRRADIAVVCAGKSYGTDLYHSVRVLSNSWSALKKGGTIILVAECSNGVGDVNFLDYSRKFPEHKELLSELRYRFKLGAHVSLFLQEALERYRIQLVSVLPDLYTRDSFKLKSSRTASSAVQSAIRVEGKEAKVLIITRGDLTLPVVSESR